MKRLGSRRPVSASSGDEGPERHGGGLVLGGVLAMGMTAAVVPSASLSVLADFVVRDLRLTHAQVGILITIFSASGALWSPLAGYLTDRAGGRTVLLATFSFAAIGVVLLALVPTYAWMLPVLVIAGFANGASNPATNRIIAEGVPVGRRGTIVGIKQSGVQLSYLLAGVTLPTIAIMSTWRWALMAMSLVPLAGIAGIKFMSTEHRIGGRGSTDQRDCKRSPGAGWLVAYAFFMGAALGSIIAYLPLFSIQRVGFGVRAAGLLMSLMSAVGIVVRILLGRHGESAPHFGRPLSVLALVSAMGVGLIWGSEMTSSWLLWAAGLVLGSSLLAWNSIGMLAVMRDAGPARTGRASGSVLAGFLAGLAASPTLFGYSVDLTHSYDIGWAGLIGILLLAASCSGVWARASREGRPRGF